MSPASALGGAVPLGLGVLLVLAAGHFGAVVARVLPSVVATDLQGAFGLSDAAFGLLHGPTFVLVYAAGLVAAAAIVDRVNRYRAMAICILVWTSASLACALATSFEGLVVARVFVGLGQAAFTPCAVSLISDRVHGTMGRSMSIFTAGAALGRSGGLLLGGAAMAALAWLAPVWVPPMDPWRWVYVVLSLPGLILAGALIGRQDARTQGPGHPGLTGAATWLWRRRAAFGPYAVAACAAVLLNQAATAWMPSVFQRAFALDAATAALVTGTIILVCAPLGHLIGGAVIDRLTAMGRPPAHGLITGLTVAAGFGLLLGMSETVVVAAIAYAGFSASLGTAGLSALVGFQPMTPPDRRGAVTSLYLATVTLVGLGLGPPLVGVISDGVFPSEAGLRQALAVVIVLTAGLGVAAAALGLPAWRRLNAQAADG